MLKPGHYAGNDGHDRSAVLVLQRRMPYTLNPDSCTHRCLPGWRRTASARWRQCWCWSGERPWSRERPKA